MEKLSPYIGICSWFTPGNNIDEKIKFVTDAGLDGIELDFNHANGRYLLAEKSYREKLKMLRQQKSVDFPAIALNALCEFGMSQSSCRAQVEWVINNGIETAADLDIPIAQLPSFFSGDIQTEEGFEHTVKMLQLACDVACEFDITIGSENALDGEEQLKLVDRVSRPNFKIYFDCRNSWWMKGIPALPILEKVYPHVCEVHLKDGVGQNDAFLPLGDGDTGVVEIIGYLKAQHYSGRMLLENDYNQFSREGKDPYEQVKKDKLFYLQHLI